MQSAHRNLNLESQSHHLAILPTLNGCNGNGNDTCSHDISAVYSNSR